MTDWKKEFLDNKDDRFEHRGYIEWDKVIEFIAQQRAQVLDELLKKAKEESEIGLIEIEILEAIAEEIKNG